MILGNGQIRGSADLPFTQHKQLFVLSTGNRECEPSNFPKISVSFCPSNQVIWHMEEGAVRVTCYLQTLGKLPKS